MTNATETERPSPKVIDAKTFWALGPVAPLQNSCLIFCPCTPWRGVFTARPIIISADHVRSLPATSLLASVVIPTRQKVLDVKSRLMTCAYILEHISSRSPQ
jgi:hypothetical protein